MKSKSSSASTFLGKYKNKRKLGKGAFGDVFLVQDEKGELFALKVIDRQKMSGENAEMIEYLMGQIKCMQDMQYDNIVKLINFQQDDDFYYMVLEYCDGGDLVNLQATFPNKVFTLEAATEYLSQVILGLETLHKAGYLHRDIKLQNVLVKNQNGKKKFKLADFGFSKKARNVGGTVLGTEQYMSPQIYRCGIETTAEDEDVYGFEVDMWAFGVLLYYMLNMAFPFQLNPYWSIEEKYKELVKQANAFSYKKAVKATRKKIVENCTDPVQDLFKKIFNTNVEKRITFAQIRQHPVFSKYFPIASVESQVLYKNKFKSTLLKKGNSTFMNKLKLKVGDESKQKIGVSSICVIDEEKQFPRESQIFALQLQQIQFLSLMAAEIGLVQKSIGSTKSLMFTYNMMKYYIILLGNFLKKLTVSNYQKRYKQLQWNLFLNSPQFQVKKKDLVLKLSTARMKFEQIYNKCSCNLQEISQMNEFFKSAFTEEVDQQDEFSGNFFSSYRKSTYILYSTLKDFLKTNKIKQFYFYLCITCICHVFNDFYESQPLKNQIFDTYISQQTEKTELFSYQRLVYYLRNCGKEKLLKLAKKIIEECMMAKK